MLPSPQLILEHFYHPRNPVPLSGPSTPGGILLPGAPELLGSLLTAAGGSYPGQWHYRGLCEGSSYPEDMTTRKWSCGAPSLFRHRSKEMISSRVCGASRHFIYMIRRILCCVWESWSDQTLIGTLISVERHRSIHSTLMKLKD